MPGERLQGALEEAYRSSVPGSEAKPGFGRVCRRCGQAFPRFCLADDVSGWRCACSPSLLPSEWLRGFFRDQTRGSEWAEEGHKLLLSGTAERIVGPMPQAALKVKQSNPLQGVSVAVA
jgi:hypothetical protein